MVETQWTQSALAGRTPDSPIAFFVNKALENPALISLAAGLVDTNSLPTAEIGEAVAAIMADPKRGKLALQYGSTQGWKPLREKILERCCHRDGVNAMDVSLGVDDVIVTTGSQQFLYLVGEALLNPGDIVIAEAPSYFVYQGCLVTFGVKVIGIPLDENGMNVEVLERVLSELRDSGELSRVKMIYTVDYFQNPTGLTLSEERRPKLVDLAKRFSTEHRIMIVEDAAYRELRFDGPDLPSVKSFDADNTHTIYTTTFSKPCSPGLKTGFAIVPSDMVRTLLNLKSNHDFGSGHLAQHIVDELLESGMFDRHVLKLRKLYQSKRDAMLTALDREFADWPEAKWTHPVGGMFSWLMLPEHFDTGMSGPLVQRGLDAGVIYIPGQYGHVMDATGHIRKNEIRLSYGVADEATIDEGIKRLRQACRGLE